MKWSMFIFKSDLKGKKILYNTINDAIVELGEEEYNIIDSYVKNNSCIDVACKGYINKLKDMEYLLSDDIDEKDIIMKAIEDSWNEDDFLCIHILPTTNCNFKCKYCYQSGIFRESYLSGSDIDVVIKYIEKCIDYKRIISHSNIILHGGEPTLNWKAVEILMPIIKRLYDKHSITFHTQIVTNAYLLTPEKVDLLSKYNWNRAQITLDGTKDMHNKRRTLKNNGETFDNIIENMKYILNNDKLDHISLRINYDKENIDDIPNLLYFIKNTFDVQSSGQGPDHPFRVENRTLKILNYCNILWISPKSLWITNYARNR